MNDQKLRVSLIFIIIAAIGFGVRLSLLETDESPTRELKITGFSWARSIDIQDFMSVQRTVYEPPEDSVVIENHSVVCDKTRIPGTYRYRAGFCNYYVVRMMDWETTSTHRTFGDNKYPHWPVAYPNKNQKLANEVGTYTVHASDQNGTVSFYVPEDQWLSLQIGQTVKVNLNTNGYPTTIAEVPK